MKISKSKSVTSPFVEVEKTDEQDTIYTKNDDTYLNSSEKITYDEYIKYCSETIIHSSNKKSARIFYDDSINTKKAKRAYFYEEIEPPQIKVETEI